MRWTAAFSLTASVLLVSGVRPASAEDIALLFAVNKYPNLRPGSNLGGCVNDAALIATKLQNYGFKTTVISDEKATHDGILNAIKNAPVGPKDRLVIYFAGHGLEGTGGKGHILPSDAEEKSEDNDIQSSELYSVVNALPAASKTVLLDSCFSGAMVPATRAFNRNITPRCYSRSVDYQQKLEDGAKAWQKIKATKTDPNDSDDTDIITGGGTKVCYFAAATSTQTAGETEFEGERHGVFTYFLAQQLSGTNSLWQDISGSVGADVMAKTEGLQKPVLAPADFLDNAVFTGDGKVTPDPKPKPGPDPKPEPKPEPLNVAKLLALDMPQESAIKLELSPATSPVVVNVTNQKLKVTVGRDGYLVLVNRDPKGNLYVVWPEVGLTGVVGPTEVKAGQVITFPSADDEFIQPDTPGQDVLKAILFTKKEAADTMSRAISGTKNKSVSDGMKAWKKVKLADSDFYTSSVITLVEPKP